MDVIKIEHGFMVCLQTNTAVLAIRFFWGLKIMAVSKNTFPTPFAFQARCLPRTIFNAQWAKSLSLHPQKAL
jgi:hypothetical protein